MIYIQYDVSFIQLSIPHLEFWRTILTKTSIGSIQMSSDSGIRAQTQRKAVSSF